MRSVLRRSNWLLAGVAAVSLAILGVGFYGIIHALNRKGPDVLAYRLTYTRAVGKQAQIYMLNRDASTDQLTDEGFNNDESSWSPDGKRMTFVRDSSIFVRDDIGERKLTEASGSSPHWSPDGTKIAYSFMGPNTTSNGFLWLMDASGANQHTVFAADGPSKLPSDCAGGFAGGWYPGGDRLLYRGYFTDGSVGICSVATDGTGPRTLFYDAATKKSAYSPAVSPDGTKIAFVVQDPDFPRIYIANADGSNPQELLSEAASADGPAWSPDGLWIAFSAQSTGLAQLYMVHPDGTELTRLTTDDNATDKSPAWVPN